MRGESSYGWSEVISSFRDSSGVEGGRFFLEDFRRAWDGKGLGGALFLSARFCLVRAPRGGEAVPQALKDFTGSSKKD